MNHITQQWKLVVGLDDKVPKLLIELIQTQKLITISKNKIQF